MAGRRTLPDIMDNALGLFPSVGTGLGAKAAPIPLGKDPQMLSLEKRLKGLRLSGMAQALEELSCSHGDDILGVRRRMEIMLDKEQKVREERGLKRRLAMAALSIDASFEGLDFSHQRGMDRELIESLGSGDWIDRANNMIITGPAGVGKTYLACALAYEAVVRGRSALYRRLPQVLNELSQARVDGSFDKTLSQYAKADVLVMDDWGTVRLNPMQLLDLLEILQDRQGKSATLVAGRCPSSRWSQVMGHSVLSGAIVDRLVHGAYRIGLQGSSLCGFYSESK